MIIAITIVSFTTDYLYNYLNHRDGFTVVHNYTSKVHLSQRLWKKLFCAASTST